MNKKKIFFFLCFLFFALILYSVVKNIVEGEKGKIKRIIFSAKRAIEKEDLVRLSGYVSFDYRDKYGNDRKTLLYLSKTVFNEYQDIALQMKDLKIELNESGAFAQIDVLGLARSSGEAEIDSPLEYDRVKLKVNFKKEKEQWKVIELEFLEPQQIYPLRDFIPLSKIDILRNFKLKKGAQRLCFL